MSLGYGTFQIVGERQVDPILSLLQVVLFQLPKLQQLIQARLDMDTLHIVPHSRQMMHPQEEEEEAFKVGIVTMKTIIQGHLA
jgi:hypothetical protein